MPHFSSAYGQWSDTEKQLFDDFRKKVGKPVSDVRAWRAKDGRMGVRYKLGGNTTAITFDDLAKQYGLNQPQQPPAGGTGNGPTGGTGNGPTGGTGNGPTGGTGNGPTGNGQQNKTPFEEMQEIGRAHV